MNSGRPSCVIVYALAYLETIEIFSTRDDRCLRRFRSVEENPAAPARTGAKRTSR